MVSSGYRTKYRFPGPHAILGTMKTIRGAEIGRLLPQIDRLASEKLRLIGKFDGVNVLFRLDDAWETLALACRAGIAESEGDRNKWDRAVYRYALTMRATVADAIEVLLDEGPERGRYVYTLPRFQVFVSNKDSATTVEGATHFGVVTPGFTYWMTYPIKLAGQVNAEGLIAMEPGEAELKFFTFDLVWEWLRLLHSKRIARMALHYKTGLVTREDRDFDFGMLEDTSNLPDLEKVLAHEGFDMRSIDGAARTPDAWNSDLRKKVVEGLPTLEMGLHSDENIRSVENQIEATKRAYVTLSGFEEEFSSHFGHAFTDFVEVCRDLLAIAREHEHTVCCQETSRLATKIGTGLGTGVALQIMNSMIRHTRTSLDLFPIVEIEGRSIFQYGRVLSALSNRAKLVYDTKYGNDPKGKAFEERCRNVLVDCGLAVIPRPTEIRSGFMLEKNSTDIDVIARKNQFILVLECKAEKYRVSGKYDSNDPNTTQNKFATYATETYRRAEWLCEPGNIGRTEDRDLARLISEQPEWQLLPLVVTTYPINPGARQRKVGVITLAELERLATSPGPSLDETGGFVSLKEITSGGEGMTPLIHFAHAS